MLQGIPGIICMFLIDHDGKLLYQNGRFDISPDELGAQIAVNLSAIRHAGNLLQQELSTVLVEYNKMKIYHIKIGAQYFLILLMKIKDSYFGEVRIRLNKAIAEIQKKL